MQQQSDETASGVNVHPQRVLAKSTPLTLGPISASARTARVSATAQLTQWGCDHLADDTAAVVAELVANAITASMPTGAPIRLRMIRTDSSVVVEVFDRAPGEPTLATATAEAESGRGLRIVAVLSRQWGWTWLRDGKVVWAEVTE